MTDMRRNRDFPAFEELMQDTLQVMVRVHEMSELLTKKASPSRINEMFGNLVDLIAHHFLREETLMESAGYLGLPWHRVVHRELLNEMRLALSAGTDQQASLDKPLLRRIRGVFNQETDDEDIFRARAKLGMFREVLPDVRPADLAAALLDFDTQQRSEIFGDLATIQASGTLEEVDPRLQRELVASLSIERVAELIDFMSPAQAATVLRNLTPAESWAILQQLGPVRSRKIAALVEKHRRESLLHLATLRYIRVEPGLACGVLLANYRALAAQALVWRYIYIISPAGVLLGVADMKDILLAEPTKLLSDVMMTGTISLTVDDTVSSAARLFDHYDFEALPVLDERGELKGVLVARDVMTAGEW